MKIVLLGFLLLCYLSAIKCELTYVGISGDKFIYEYFGRRYALSHDFKKLHESNPQLAEQKFPGIIANNQQEQTSNRLGGNRPSILGNLRPSNLASSNSHRNPTGEEIVNSQQVNSFRPNAAKPQSEQNLYPGAINFPPSNIPTNAFNAPQRPPVPPSKNEQHFGHRDDEEFAIRPPSTGFNRPIPKDRDRNREEAERGTKLVTEFAWNLFKNSNNQPNYVLSPLSPQILLAYLAWVADGSTRNEILSVNGFGSPSNMERMVNLLKAEGNGRELQIATAFFHSKEMRLNQEFLDKSIENVDVIGVDFKQPSTAGRTISRWAEQKTKGALKLNQVNYAPSTKIALTSAMYFKGNWIYTFPPAKPGTFRTPSGPVNVPMMNMKKKFRWGKIGTYAEWVALPYESSDSLIIILPNRDQQVDYVMSLMSPQDFENVITSIDSEASKADVNITMPRFKIESNTNLINPLQKMGIRTLFSQSAELPYLSDYDSVQVSNAHQQASIEVNEQGTVAVSFTNFNVVALSFQPTIPDVEFTVDRPFIAVIADRNRYIPYCVAKITNPLA